MRLKISTNALNDHGSRLYGHENSTDTVRVHQDIVGATYSIIKITKKVMTVEMSDAAIKEFLDDADYCKESMIDDSPSIARLFERAAASVRKQLETK